MKRLTEGEQNLGSVQLALFLPLQSVESTGEPDVEDNNILDLTTIELADDIGGWDYFGFTFETGTVKEESRETENGPLYTYTLEGRLSKNTVNRRNDFELYDNCELIVVCADVNGDVLLIGSCEDGEKSGMKMTTQFAEGPEIKSRNSHLVTLRYETFTRAYHAKNEDLLTVIL